MKKWIWIVVLVVIVIIVAAVSSKPKDNSPIKIGFIGPLSGDAASFGEVVKKSVDLAVNEVNQSGGINGRKIQIIYEDGKCNGTTAVSAAHKLVDIDKVRYIIGGMCSSESFSIIPITNSAGVLTISPVSSAAKLSGISPLFLRNNPSDAITGAILSDYLATKYKTAAILSEESDFSQGIKDVFITESQKNGLNIIDIQDFSTGTKDFRSILSKLKSKNPDVIFVNPRQPEGFTPIIQQIKDLKVNSQLASTLVASGPNIVSNPIMNGIISADLGDLSKTKGQDFLNKYFSTYGTKTDYPLYDGAAYDDVYLLSEAIAKVGDDPVRVGKYLHSITNYTGTLGDYHFDQNGDIVGAGIILQQIVNGQLINL